MPKGNERDVCHKTYYSISFSAEHKQASWAAYNLSGEHTAGRFERESTFRYDANVPGGSAKSTEYSKSGYDRGHLVPAADMAFDSIAMFESFLMSNISPQVPAFNRGIWKKLEELFRGWAVDYKQIFIVTGPVLKSNLPLKKIGNSKISIPDYFYKIAFDYNEKKPKMIGFLLKNEGSAKALFKFAVPVDSIEVVSGIDFFPLLPDSVEKKLEKQCSVSEWSFIP